MVSLLGTKTRNGVTNCEANCEMSKLDSVLSNLHLIVMEVGRVRSIWDKWVPIIEVQEDT